MVVKDQYGDSTKVKHFLSKTKDEAAFILDKGCKGAHICKDPALLVTMQETPMVVKIEIITGHYPSKERLFAFHTKKPAF
jgi:hypothetical protein